ncbi:MAG: L,D-transpeptidase family protein [Woeseiaceae bacterium]
MRRSTLFCILLIPALAAADNLPGYVLLLPESVETVLIAETDTATLHRYEVASTAVVSSDVRRMSIGQNGVGKKKSGDRRTPLGVYFVIENLDTRNLHEKYGPVAFPLDYPNAWDTRNSRTGHGIWIHGVAAGSGLRPERDTDGCIALPNDELLALEADLTPLRTPVIVTRRIHEPDPTEKEETRKRLLTALDGWQRSYREGDWFRYLSFYADDFAYRGLDRDEWLAYRLQTVGNRPIDDFSIDDVMLVADPEEASLFLSRFTQRIVEPDRTVETIKRLYWRRAADGAFKVVAEDNG